jgi:hypothetical protein
MGEISLFGDQSDSPFKRAILSPCQMTAAKTKKITKVQKRRKFT